MVCGAAGEINGRRHNRQSYSRSTFAWAATEVAQWRSANNSGDPAHDRSFALDAGIPIYHWTSKLARLATKPIGMSRDSGRLGDHWQARRQIRAEAA